MENETIKLSPHSTKSIKLDLKRNLLHIESYETKIGREIEILDWIESNIKEQTGVFKTYDGMGQVIYSYLFYGMSIVENSVSFDYDNSDSSARKILVKFEKYRLKYEDKEFEQDQEYLYKVKFGTLPETSACILNRPTLRIEETKVNHLNATTWIPGKAQWETLHLSIDKDGEKSSLPALLKRDYFDMDIKVLSKDGDLLEKWHLGKCHVLRTLDKTHGYDISLKYSEVDYFPYGD